MMLLFMIAYAQELNLSNIDKQDCIDKINTVYLTTSSKGNPNIEYITDVWEFVLTILKLTYATKFSINSCNLDKTQNQTKMSNYLNSKKKEAYKILFGVTEDSDFNQIVQNIECIFNSTGNLKLDLMTYLKKNGNPFDPHTNFSCDSSA